MLSSVVKAGKFSSSSLLYSSSKLPIRKFASRHVKDELNVDEETDLDEDVSYVPTSLNRARDRHDGGEVDEGFLPTHPMARHLLEHLQTLKHTLNLVSRSLCKED